MKLKIAICDDEQILCESAKESILNLKNGYEVDTYFSVYELMDSYILYDAIFLDIEMPGKNGMETAYDLRNKGYKGEIVFLTSHSEFMQEAFKVRAYRFITKPICDYDLEESLNQLENEIRENEIISIESFGKNQFVYVKDIIYIEAKKKYTVIYMCNGIIETAYSLKYWFERLSDKDFFQVHKSYIVSMYYILVIETGSIHLREIGISIPVSRRRYSDVRQKYFEYVNLHARII